MCKQHLSLPGLLQKYGVVEGKPLSEMRAMAKAAGEECPMFTPPGGETLEQVCSPNLGCHMAGTSVNLPVNSD